MRYIYYLIYLMLKEAVGNPNPAISATFLLAIWQGMNFFTLMMLVNYFLGANFLRNESSWFGIMTSFLVLIIDYFALYRKTESICVRFENKTTKKSVLLVLLYLIGTVAIFFLVGETLVTNSY